MVLLVLPLDFWSVSHMVRDHRRWLQRTRLAKSCQGVLGFEPPSWHALLHGARPPLPDEFDPGSWRTGWQHEAASRVDRSFRAFAMMPVMTDSEKALLRSQSGPFSGAALSATPSSFPLRIAPGLFRVLLLRRLRLPSPSHCSHLPMWPPT